MKIDPAPASRNQIKEWKKLLRGKYRKKYGLFLAEGVRCVEQIIENKNVTVRELLIDQSDPVHQHLQRSDLPVYELTNEQFTAVSDTESPQGVIAVCEIPDEAKFDEVSKKSGIIVVLDAIQDPGNLGTIIRTSAWFGVSGIVFGEGCVDPFHPKVVRSTAGSTSSIPSLRGDLPLLLDEFESQGWQTLLMDGGELSMPLSELNPSDRSLLVIGNEANGIESALFQRDRISIKIPGTAGTVESLNAAVALSIALYSLSGK